MKANNYFVLFNMAVFILYKKKQVLFAAKSRLFSLKPIYLHLLDFPPHAYSP